MSIWLHGQHVELFLLNISKQRWSHKLHKMHRILEHLLHRYYEYLWKVITVIKKKDRIPKMGNLAPARNLPLTQSTLCFGFPWTIDTCLTLHSSRQWHALHLPVETGDRIVKHLLGGCSPSPESIAGWWFHWVSDASYKGITDPSLVTGMHQPQSKLMGIQPAAQRLWQNGSCYPQWKTSKTICC